MSDRDLLQSPTRRCWKTGVMVVLLVAILTSPVTLLSLAFWAASDSWEFAGGGLRHWVLVKGTTVDQLGAVASVGGPIRYVVRIQEGTDPGEVAAIYDSDALPAAIVKTYAERCLVLGLPIEREFVSPDGAKAKLGCQSNPGDGWADDVRIVAERRSATSLTRVRIFAGPGLIATYSF